MSVLKKLWWGQYSLPMTFWGFYVVGYFVVARLLFFFLVSLLLNSLPQLRPIMIILGQCFDVAYLTVASVGVWRSADNTYKAAKVVIGFSAYNFGWGNLAKAAVALWAVRYVYYFINGGALRIMEAVTGH